jgi:hypothetical protein
VDGSTLTFALGIKPSNSNSVVAIFNNVKLDTEQYVIDYELNTFTFSSSTPGTGWLSLSSMQLGTIQILDYNYQNITVTGTTVLSMVNYDDIGSDGASEYVTIDGVPAILGIDYTLSSYKSRAQFTFYKLGNVQSYLFGGPVKSFSEINEQIELITVPSLTIPLQQPPGKVGPFHSQVIVTKNGRRLTPPITTYYQVENNQRSFNISESIIFSPRTISLKNIEVYINGVMIPPARTWRLNQQDGQIKFSSNVLNNGDVIAIVVKHDNEYLIENNQLILTNPTTTSDIFHITTFTNHDPDFIRTERFNGDPVTTYRMQRPIFDSSYVWVTINGQPLIANLDYSVSTDGYIVTIRNGIPQGSTDSVVITSFANIRSTQLTAYRIFKDILGRTHYKRLSSENYTTIAQDFLISDDTILVKDASVLTIPNIVTNTPGIVLINGERIEFFTINNNELGQLRRGTLGTMPSVVHAAGSTVIDQGADQTMPFVEFTQNYVTATTTSTQLTFNLAGHITFNTSTSYADQIEVYYGGMPLLKPNTNTATVIVSHNFNASYDSNSDEPRLSPGFIITGTTLILSTTSNFIPKAGIKLEIISRNSRIFGDTQSPEMKFLLDKPAILPAAIVGHSNIEELVYLETGLLLTDENNTPLEGI